MAQRRFRRISAFVVLVALTALSVAGCSGFQGGIVAYVGSAEISETQLDSAVAGVTESLEEGQQVSTDAVINVLIHGAIAEQVAAARNITVTDGQREQVLQGSNLVPLLSVPAAKDVAFDIATQQIVATRIGAEAYLQEVAKIPVTLNPRFGVLNTAEKTIVEGLSSSLSRPA
jgi:hypothetical protein